MSSMKTFHFVLSPAPAWGHVRPFCIMATRIVREQDHLVITFIVAPYLLDLARIEVSRQFHGDKSPESSKALQRIRILAPCLQVEVQPIDLSLVAKTFAEAYPAAYETLYQAKPITCSVTGTTFDIVPPPSVAIIDLFQNFEIRATRAVSGRSVPIIACGTGGAGIFIRFVGPEYIGGMGDLGAKIDAEVVRTGLPVSEIGPKIFGHTEGKVIRIPGVPAMYDYEFFPQKLPFPSMHAIVGEAYHSLHECDAVISTSSHVYESMTLDAMKQWLSDVDKGLHVFGPLLPAGYGTETQNNESGAGATDVEAFLGEMLAEHGKRSVFFVSFGSMLWPEDTEYIDELLEALVEKKAPFIFALASPAAKISEELQNEIKSSGLGLLTAWAPQQFILNHPATGWFIGHCGFNSVTESLGSGIPLICWPFNGDQPLAAVHLTENLNVAFELVEVRNRDNLRPLHRSGCAPKGTREAVGIEIRLTVDLCRGQKGEKLRRNAEQIKTTFAKAWEEDSVARKEMRDFLHKYTRI